MNELKRFKMMRGGDCIQEVYIANKVDAYIKERLPRWVSVDVPPPKSGEYWVIMRHKSHFGIETYQMQATFDTFWEYTCITHWLDNIPLAPKEGE